MSKSQVITEQPEIAIFEATDTGEEATAPDNNNSRFNGWKVIRSGSHALGKWTSSSESLDDTGTWVCGNEAMQQMIADSEWNDPTEYRDPPGVASIISIGMHTTPWHINQITTAHQNGYRVGVLVPSDPLVRAKLRKLHDAGVPTIDVTDEMSVVALESLVREFAYRG